MRMTLRTIAMVTVAFMSATVAIATQPTPSDRQIFIMKSAYQIAKEDGHEDPSILQGIVMTESTAGAASSKIHNGSVGVSQILVGTAKYVLRAFPNLAEEYFPNGFTKQQLVNKLTHDDIFNLRIASAYLKLMKRENHLRGDKLIAAYNRGPGAVPSDPSQFGYVKKVRYHARSNLAVDARNAVLQERDSTIEYTSNIKDDTMN